jgi:hypothetical protein
MMNRTGTQQTLLRTLDALERELLDASDAEVLAAAAELQLQPGMKGSIALVGVTQLVRKGKPSAGGSVAGSSRRRAAAIRPPKE